MSDSCVGHSGDIIISDSLAKKGEARFLRELMRKSGAWSENAQLVETALIEKCTECRGSLRPKSGWGRALWSKSSRLRRLHILIISP